MDSILKEFFEVGKTIRQKRRTGVFAIVEQDEVIVETIRKWVDPTTPLLTFDCPVTAIQFFHKHPTQIKCVIVNMDSGGLCDSENVIKFIDKELPEIICIVYTKSAEEANYLTNNYPRITVIYNADGVRNLIDSLNSEMVNI